MVSMETFKMGEASF